MVNTLPDDADVRRSRRRCCSPSRARPAARRQHQPRRAVEHLDGGRRPRVALPRPARRWCSSFGTGACPRGTGQGDRPVRRPDRRRPDVAVLHVHRRQRDDAGRRRQQRLPPRPPLPSRVLHARPAGGDRDEPARGREQPAGRLRQPGNGVAAVVRSRRLPQVEQGERRGGAEVLPRRRAVVGGVRVRHLAGVRRDRIAATGRRRRDGHRRGRADSLACSASAS